MKYPIVIQHIEVKIPQTCIAYKKAGKFQFLLLDGYNTNKANGRLGHWRRPCYLIVWSLLKDYA